MKERSVSKKLQAILDTYRIELRDKPETVAHLTYRTQTVLSPVQFAVYEAAVKAVYKSSQIYNAHREMSNFLGTMMHYQAIADPNDIVLPFITDTMTMEDGKAANDEFRICADWLTKAGLYYDLLD